MARAMASGRPVCGARAQLGLDPSCTCRLAAVSERLAGHHLRQRRLRDHPVPYLPLVRTACRAPTGEGSVDRAFAFGYRAATRTMTDLTAAQSPRLSVVLPAYNEDRNPAGRTREPVWRPVLPWRVPGASVRRRFRRTATAHRFGRGRDRRGFETEAIVG
jgi:hypothetical protein